MIGRAQEGEGGGCWEQHFFYFLRSLRHYYVKKDTVDVETQNLIKITICTLCSVVVYSTLFVHLGLLIAFENDRFLFLSSIVFKNDRFVFRKNDRF